MELTRITRSDAAAIQRLLESNPEYSRRVEGAGPAPTAAVEALAALPPQVDSSQKLNLGLWDGPELVAFADVIIGWPESSTAHIGLLITDGARHGEGLGREMHSAVAEFVSENQAIRTLRISIVDTNADLAERFWVKLGYEPTGETAPYTSGSVASTARIWTRPVGFLSAPDPVRLRDPETGEELDFHARTFTALVTGIVEKFAGYHQLEAARLVAEHPLFAKPVTSFEQAVFFSHDSEYHWAMLVAHGEGYWRSGIPSEPPANYDEWESEFLVARGLAGNSFVWVAD